MNTVWVRIITDKVGMDMQGKIACILKKYDSDFYRINCFGKESTIARWEFELLLPNTFEGDKIVGSMRLNDVITLVMTKNERSFNVRSILFDYDTLRWVSVNNHFDGADKMGATTQFLVEALRHMAEDVIRD